VGAGLGGAGPPDEEVQGCPITTQQAQQVVVGCLLPSRVGEGPRLQRTWNQQELVAARTVKSGKQLGLVNSGEQAAGRARGVPWVLDLSHGHWFHLCGSCQWCT
jgi:hypothetical protein